MNERETNALERVKRKERERITRTSAENDIDIQRRISRSDYEEMCSINNEDTFDQNALAFFSRKRESRTSCDERKEEQEQDVSIYINA